MKVLFCVVLMHSMYLCKLSSTDTIESLNHTLDSANKSAIDLLSDQNFTTTENYTDFLEPSIDSKVTLAPVAYKNVTVTSTSASTIEHTLYTSSPRLSLSSLMLTVTDVTRLCQCNQLKNQCDVNCCCDPDCTKEIALFTSCSVRKVSCDSNLCNQDTAYYSLDVAVDGFAEMQTSVQRDVNPDILCIQFTTYETGLSHPINEVPSLGNFDGLFGQFAEFIFSSDGLHGISPSMDQVTLSGYLYGDVMETEEENGNKGFLRLPVRSVTDNCLDMNPAEFLRDQATKCSRRFSLEKDCTSLSALNTQSYTNFRLLSGKNGDATIVPLEVASITYQSLEDAQSPLQLTSDLSLDPVLLNQGADSAACINVVLHVGFLVMYSETGDIQKISVVVTLGTINATKVPIEQEFWIRFVQKNAEKVSVDNSGNPGYVLGLALQAGSRTADGIVQSLNPKGDLTILQDTKLENCLKGPHQRSPVLFGVNMLSGCTFSLEETANCSQLSEVLLQVLRGQDFPEYVASFGNSQPQNPMDWVPIENNKINMEQQVCSIPMSLNLEVRWTNYGSLANPQAQIISAHQVIQTNTSDLAVHSGNSSVIYVTSSVTFIPVSAAALPGYKATPTIDAKLPFDFFFPFV